MKCPICGGSELIDVRGRSKVRCAQCGAMDRVRSAKLLIDKVAPLSPGMRIMHLAPEQTLAHYLHSVCGAGYEAYDIFPHLFEKMPVSVKQFDLCKDVFKLPGNAFDLILHNHVLEHVPCNYSIVLLELYRALKPGGVQIFSTPIFPGHYREDLDPRLSPAERSDRYHQVDHVRMFGRDDFESTLGMVFGHTAKYSLRDFLTEEELESAGIQRRKWSLTGAAPFVVQKPL